MTMPHAPGHRSEDTEPNASATNVYLTEQQVSDRFGPKPRTLQRWRGTGDGPAYVRVGQRRVMYRLSDVEAWAAARTYAHRAAELAFSADISRAAASGTYGHPRKSGL